MGFRVYRIYDPTTDVVRRTVIEFSEQPTGSRWGVRVIGGRDVEEKPEEFVVHDGTKWWWDREPEPHSIVWFRRGTTRYGCSLPLDCIATLREADLIKSCACPCGHWENTGSPDRLKSLIIAMQMDKDIDEPSTGEPSVPQGV